MCDENNNIKKCITSYLCIGVSVLIATILLIFILGALSTKITDYANNYYRSYYENNIAGFSSPWYENGLHIVDEAFINSLTPSDKSTVYAIGSSLSSNAVDYDTLSLNDGYDYKNLVCGNGYFRSNRIFVNLCEEESSIKNNDIVKYEISYTSFRDPDVTITESVLDKWGKYSIDKNTLEVKKNTNFFSPIYRINLELIKIQNCWELLTSWYDQNRHPDRYPAPIGLCNFKNNYFNYESVAENCHYDDSYKDSIFEDLSKLNKESNLIVELSPLPEGMLATEYGKQFNACVDECIIPYLKSNNIAYRDLRRDYSDDMFIDGVHLSYDASLDYTNKLNEYINNYIENIKEQ